MARRKKAELLYDGKCPLCIRSMTTIGYFDWFDRLTFGDIERRWPQVTGRFPTVSFDDCEREIHLLLPDGSVLRGFFAFRRIAGYVPAFWPLLILFYMPGGASAGPRVYEWIASRRVRFHGCSLGGCSTVTAEPKAAAGDPSSSS
jgi:predicted DCC family thiol-disulfide oxidoreductase YuxK